MHIRATQVVLVTIALGAIGFGLIHTRKDDRERAGALKPAVASPAQASGAESAANDAVEDDDGRSQVAMSEQAKPLTADDVTRLVSDTTSGNPSTRASAILALVNAPKSEAIPALQRIVEGGEPSVDRPLALQALRDVALYQGDEDGVIRGVVRETIYHADDDTLVERAQVALEIIEESEMVSR